MADDTEALFRDWLAGHRGTVLKVARAYTRTPADRKDLTQEILLQVWRSLPQFRGEARSATWCYRVALNTALGWKRKERVRQTRHRPLPDAEIVAAADDPAPQPDLVARLYVAIRRLPDADAALVLLHLDGLSYRQMGEVLGITEGHVGVKLNRAKKALGELMKEATRDA